MKIKATFTTLAAAVAASKMDLSYNEQAANEKIQDIERNCSAAYLMEDNTVKYVFEGKQHGRLLNTFSPFHGVLSDSPLYPAQIIENKIDVLTGWEIKKSNLKARLAWNKAGFLLC